MPYRINFAINICYCCKQEAHKDRMYWTDCCRKYVCDDCIDISGGKIICVDCLPGVDYAGY